MASPTRKTVELFYDVISPYSWIGFEVLCRYRQKWNIDLKLKPFFLGGVMKAAENQPPAMVPRRGAYMHQDVDRLAKHFQIPVHHPPNLMDFLFNTGSLGAMRLVMAVDMYKPQLTEALSRELWMRGWSRGEDINQPESFIQASKAAGLGEADLKELLPKVQSKETKERLARNTNEALDYGAFGAPTIIAHVGGEKHMVFGSDRFHILADLLGEKYEGPLVEYSAKL